MITYPLNNILYDAQDAELYNASRTSGVYSVEDFPLSRTGNEFVIGEGLAWIRNARFSGKVVASKEKTTLNIENPDPVYQRYDVIAIQFDSTKNESSIVVKNGNKYTGEIPERETQEDLYELYLYIILHHPGTGIESSLVNDVRLDREYCGLMADSVTNMLNHIALESLIEKPENADIWKSSDGVVHLEGNSFVFENTQGAMVQSPKGLLFVGGTRFQADPESFVSINALEGRVANVLDPEEDGDAVPKSYLKKTFDVKTSTVNVSIAGAQVPFVFTKTGNVVVLNVAYHFLQDIPTSSDVVFVDIPEGMQPNSEFVVSQATTSALWGRSVNVPSPVGAISFNNENQLCVFYEIQGLQVNPSWGWSFGANMTWVSDGF